jgi:hypothetical protein
MRILKLLCAIVVTACLAARLALPAFAASEAAFPADWQSWPVTASGTILGADTAIPSNAPRVLIETVKAYNWVNNGKGSAYQIHVNPAKRASYIAHQGKYTDGGTSVLALTDAKVILVTEHLLGEPQYGVFTFDGKDLEGAHPSLKVETCRTCHTGFADICLGGICSVQRP